MPLSFGHAGGDVFACIANKDPKTRAYQIFRSSKDVAPFLHLRTMQTTSLDETNFVQHDLCNPGDWSAPRLLRLPRVHDHVL